ncbi:citrulline utilization hydrolase CtlX [Auraticoccus monumenti]|uniref:Amidinotransferase n=1 Tax=Auraticoccus monumenti TaxID=675864 RepID=A0A1G6T2L6_9ACTN|nr:arginine deiminase-related protein [Auraticoccus monumenti]SDD23372.1 hypothetical protein SAMN04489747_0509 [Auraticoccus monumenti]
MTLLAEPDAVPRPRAAGSPQAPSTVVMIRPHHFRPNPQTAADNAYQVAAADRAAQDGEVAARAHGEVTRAVRDLRAAGVRVHLFEDLRDDRPDSVFCNNWFSTHADGRLVLHSMLAPNRRRERRPDVVAWLQRHHRVSQVVDLADGPVLEGTGAMVLDHDQRVAYCSRSRRADDRALAAFCDRLGYRPHVFDTAGADGRPVYHTNVMMALGTGFSLVALDLVPDPAQRRRLRRSLERRGDVVALGATQVGEFAGNAIELSTPDGPVLALSSRGLRALTTAQRAVLEGHCRVLPLDVPTCELAGGSVRCMIAAVHLEDRLTGSSEELLVTGVRATR